MTIYNWLDNRLSQYCDKWRMTLTDEQYEKVMDKLDRKIVEDIERIIRNAVDEVTEEDEQ